MIFGSFGLKYFVIFVSFYFVVEGKGFGEVIFNCEVYFILIIRNVEGGQCYNENDYVMVEILDE